MADLVQAGNVRLALFLPQYVKDPSNGELRGVGAHIVSIDVARALAARLGVAAKLIGYATPPEVVEGLKAGRCDLGIMGVDPVRAAEIGLSFPFIEFDFTYLVSVGSPIRSVDDADRPGVRIAVVRNHASSLALVRALKHADLVDASGTDGAFALLCTGRVDAMASARPTLLDCCSRLPGSRVLEDRYGVNLVAMAVPNAQAGWLSYVNEFIEEAKASGLLHELIERTGLRGLREGTSRNHD